MRVKNFASALAACAMVIGFGARTLAAEPLKIRQGWAVPTATMSPMIFTDPKMLRHYGQSYIVEPIHFAGTSPELTAIATGDVDIVTISYSTLPLAVQNARIDDLRVVADGEQDGVHGYFSSPYLVRNDSGIKSVDDLKGKVIAVNALGDAVDIAARAMFLQHGLVAQRNYSIVEGTFPVLGSMLLDGKVQLIGDVPPFIYEPKLQNATHTLFTMKDAVGASQLIMLAARESFLRKNRAALDDFFEDLVRGTRWMLDPANRTQALAVAAGFAKVPPERLGDYYLTKEDRYRDPDCLPNVAALQHNVDAQRKLGFLKAEFDVRKYVDTSFVERAAKHLK